VSAMARPDGNVGVLRGLYLVAMAMFLITIGIGILNGLNVVEFSRDQLLTHVHSGTLGWISLALITTTMWLTRSIDRRLAWALAVLIPIYVAAFYSGYLPARAVAGTALLIVILGVLVWAWRGAMADRSLPVLTVTLGLTTFGYGAIIGVLIQIQLATKSALFPAGADAIGAHAAAMVFSYLILAAMGLIEWQVRGTKGRPRAGLVQIGALFLGGFVLSGALLFGGDSAAQAAGGIDLLLNLVAIILFAVRVLPAAVRTRWGAATARRHIATAAVFVPVAMAIFMYVIFLFITKGITAISPRVLEASDHAAFIGVITNLILGLILTATADQGEDTGRAGQVGFWVMNVGLLIFLYGLMTDSTSIIAVGAPAMGVGILVVLALASIRLRASNLAATGA
jgi:hypothetical protein